jgi:hypothetical protein
MVSHANLAMNYVNMKECNYQFYNEDFRIKYRENKRMSEEMEEAMENHDFDQLSKSRLSDYYRLDEYYPTFEDYEKDMDLIAQIFENATRYKDFYAS